MDNEPFRNQLSFFLITAFVLVLPMLIFKNIPETNREVIVYMVGQLSGMATMALGYYFTKQAGQEALDAQRADNTGKLADAVVAAANATPAGKDAAATEAAAQVADAAVDKAGEIKDEHR